jgi:hypothetical protein
MAKIKAGTQFKVNKAFNSYTLTLNDVTLGKLLALTRALRYYDSPVGNDLLDAIRNVIRDSGDVSTHKEIEESLRSLTTQMEQTQAIAQAALDN